MAEALPFLTFQPSRGPTAPEAIAPVHGAVRRRRVVSEQRPPASAPVGAGTVEVAEIVVAGLHVRCRDS